MKLSHFILSFLFVSMVPTGSLQAQEHLEPNKGNPLLPGYFADPTIKKISDTFYMYATTDGVKLASGQPTVWISKDFEHWYNQEMDISLPEGLTNCWAPDVVERNGKFYYYMGNCQFGCNIYGYVSDNPIGPWTPINNGEPVIPVGTGKEHLPALDAQFFTDDDGTLYSHFGTWCTSFGGVGWAKIGTTDMATITESGLIPIAQVPRAFEASYMLKRNGKYILMYSSDDCKIHTYAVHYAWADSPIGPFHYGANNPILSTNADTSVDGPGHHSMLQMGDDYYMVYHRHDNPHSTGGMFRQTCVDKMVFLNDTTIARMDPTHQGIGALAQSSMPTNLALGAKATATSTYHLKSPANRYNKTDIDHVFSANFATDANNGTLWKAASANLPQALTIDLGKKQSFKRIATEFEYPTFYYQYQIEVSDDAKTWTLYANRSTNQTAGCPMIDDSETESRYIRITVSGVEKTGLFAAIWNVKVYDELFEMPTIQNKPEEEKGICSTHQLLVDFNAKGLSPKKIRSFKNTGALKGKFIASGKPQIEEVDGVPSIRFDGSSFYSLSELAPKSLDWNAPFTAAVWVYNPTIENGECLMVWNSREDMLQSSYAAMMYGTGHFGAVAHGDGANDLRFKTVPEAGQWHHVVLTFDGMVEKVYVNGQLNTQIPMALFVKADQILIGASGEPSENLTGNIARAQLYDYALTPEEVQNLMKDTNIK